MVHTVTSCFHFVIRYYYYYCLNSATFQAIFCLIGLTPVSLVDVSLFQCSLEVVVWIFSYLTFLQCE